MNSKPLTAEAVRDAFHRRFEAEPAFIVRTPGRVNLIGEHTDYNGGFVFPMTIDRAIWMAARERDDGVVRVLSPDYGEERSFSVNEPPEKEPLKKEEPEKGRPLWFEYIRGCAWALAEAGRPLSGFDAVLTGDVPRGAGLSSSAALEVTTLLAFAEAGGYELPKIEVAKLGQRAENEWIGVKCGIMDQAICALGEAGKAMLLDCRSLEHQFYTLPGDTVVAVMDTATRHSLASSAYNERREQCEAACRILGVPLLRDATQAMLDARAKDMPDVVYRRARHILSESLRTRSAAYALNQDAPDVFGKLMNESHFSLQYDFQISCRELDVITDLARKYPACLGARMTGGGFGGSAVALLYSTRRATDEDFTLYVKEKYRQQTGKDPHIHICRATDGGRVQRL
jgi:galactokinase